MGALVIVAAFGGVACGDDDDDEAAAPTTTAAADFTAYCDASFELESYFAEDPDVDFETATPEQIQAAADDLPPGRQAPDRRRSPACPGRDQGPDRHAGGRPQPGPGRSPTREEVFETPAVSAAEATTHAFDKENCGWGQVDVTATEYAFAGLPATIEAGRTSIDLTNNGVELHEIVLLAKNPGVTESFDEILALPEEEAMTKVTPHRSPSPPRVTPSTRWSTCAAGSYLAVCFIPQGLTSEDGPPPAEDAQPHFVLGMKQEVTVA